MRAAGEHRNERDRLLVRLEELQIGGDAALSVFAVDNREVDAGHVGRLHQDENETAKVALDSLHSIRVR
jgi:hypothetical protein